MQCHLRVSAFQVQCREPLCSSQRVQGVVDPWERKAVLFRGVIQPSVVYAEAKAAVFLPIQAITKGCLNSLMTPLPFMSSSVSCTLAWFAEGSLRGGWGMGQVSPVSILWYTVYVLS